MSNNARIVSCLVKIAQEIMEYSGADANQFADKSVPDSYEVVGDDGRGRTADLTDNQKRQVDKFTERRRKGLEFGNFEYDSNGRYYVSLPGSSAKAVQPPDEIADIIDRAGYWMPDYREGRLYRKDDKEMRQSNAPKLLTVLKKELGGDRRTYERLKKMFDERESGSNKKLDEVRLELCITCNPYDVAGMSTDRNWTSCMRLPDDFNENGGAYYSTALKQVEYGGLCAYLIRDDDRDLHRPLARIAVKRLENEAGDYIYKAESTVYGDAWMASRSRMREVLKSELDSSNAVTGKGHGIFVRNDDSYSDDDIDKEYVNLSRDDFVKMPYAELSRLFKNRDVQFSEDDIRYILDHKKERPNMGFMNAVAPLMSDAFLSDYKEYVDMENLEFYHGRGNASKKLYEGGDKPSDENDVAGHVYECIDGIRGSDDYGMPNWEENEVDLTGYFSIANFYDIVMGRQDLAKVENMARERLDGCLREFYEDEVAGDDPRFQNAAEFEKAFYKGELEPWFESENDYNENERDLYSEFYEYAADDYSSQGIVALNVHVDGTKKEDVYEIKASIDYEVGNGPVFTGYENSCVVNVGEDGWKERIMKFVKDMTNEMPYGY